MARQDDLIPDLDLGRIMRLRPAGLGSIWHVLRLTVATTASWAIAAAISRSEMALFAPVTTLLVLQQSAWTTLGISIQRVLGTGIGVFVASLWVNLVGLTWWSFLLGVGAALLIARMLPWSFGGQVQIPVAVVFVLALGAGSLEQDLWRVLDVLIGGAVGIAAIFVYPPKPQPGPLDAALRSYRDAIIAVVRLIGDQSGSLAVALPGTVRHDYVLVSRGLRSHADLARGELARFVEGSYLNLRARGYADTVAEFAFRLRRLSGIAVQVRGIAGAADRLYDHDGIAAHLSGPEFRRLIDRLVDLMVAGLGADGAPLGEADPELVIELDAALEDELKRAADMLLGQDEGPSDALSSVSLIGRLDVVRLQLSEFRDRSESAGVV